MTWHDWLPVWVLAALLSGCQTPASGPRANPTSLSPLAAATQTVSPLPSPAPTITLLSTPTPPALTFPPSLASLRIALPDEKSLWLWQNGTTVSLTGREGYAPVKLSGDGKLVAFGGNGLWVVNSDGTGERLLLRPEDLHSMVPGDKEVEVDSFDWIPNTHTLLFNTTLPGYALSDRDDLHLVDADTLQWRTLRGAGEGGSFRISPTGKQVVMVTPSAIRLMNTDGTGYRTLLKYSQIDTRSEYFYYVRPVWSLDSRSVLVDVPPRHFMDDPSLAPRVIWHLPVDGRASKEAAQLPAQYHYMISPDFSKLAYVKSSQNAADEIHVANIDGSEERTYPFGADMIFETWAPDSESFVLWSRKTQAYYSASMGSEPILLTEPGANSFVWIDELYFLYKSMHDEACELRLGTRNAGTGISTLVLVPAIEDCSIRPFDFVK
jgi:hypothetical protein